MLPDWGLQVVTRNERYQIILDANLHELLLRWNLKNWQAFSLLIKGNVLEWQKRVAQLRSVFIAVQNNFSDETVVFRQKNIILICWTSLADYQQLFSLTFVCQAPVLGYIDIANRWQNLVYCPLGWVPQIKRCGEHESQKGDLSALKWNLF